MAPSPDSPPSALTPLSRPWGSGVQSSSSSLWFDPPVEAAPALPQFPPDLPSTQMGMEGAGERRRAGVSLPYLGKCGLAAPSTGSTWMAGPPALFFLATLCGLQGLSFPTRDWTGALSSKSAESQPLDHRVGWGCLDEQ